jgi:hypothetical protein
LPEVASKFLGTIMMKFSPLWPIKTPDESLLVSRQSSGPAL